MTTKNLGDGGFKWFVGVVEDRDDPEYLGRVRVRVYNLHGNKMEAPTDSLPWAPVLMPPNSSSLKQVGISPTGLQIDSTVVGFFLDGEEATMPIVFGVLPGVGDISLLAKGKMSINKELFGIEPPSAFKALYPFNKVVETESGHVFEVDDTPNQERIHQYHRSGTYTEIDPEGRRVNKIVGDDYEIVQKNQKIYIQGNVDMQVKGNYTLNVTGNIVVNGKIINMNKGTQGAARIGDTADTADPEGLVGTNKIESGSGTVFIGD